MIIVIHVYNVAGTRGRTAMFVRRYQVKQKMAKAKAAKIRLERNLGFI